MTTSRDLQRRPVAPRRRRRSARDRHDAVRRRQAGRRRTPARRRARPTPATGGSAATTSNGWPPADAALPRRHHRRRRDLPDAPHASRRSQDALHGQRPDASTAAEADRRLRQGRLRLGAGPLLAPGRDQRARRPRTRRRTTPTGLLRWGQLGHRAGRGHRRPAVTFDGVDGAVGSVGRSRNPTVYSEELWFKTTTTRGGKIIGFGDSQTGAQRQLRPARLHGRRRPARVRCLDRARRTRSRPATRYNDGTWHHVVATQGAGGMKLYVDGALVGDEPADAGRRATTATGGWAVTPPGAATQRLLRRRDRRGRGLLHGADRGDGAARTTQAGGGHLPNQAPTAAFTSTVTDLAASFDGSGSTDSDGTVASYAWDFGDGARPAPARSRRTRTRRPAPTGDADGDRRQGGDRPVTSGHGDRRRTWRRRRRSPRRSTGLAASFDGSGSSGLRRHRRLLRLGLR